MVGRESCNKMALRYCTSTEMRWYKKLASLGSPVLREILKQISFYRLLAEELKTLRVSRARGQITATSQHDFPLRRRTSVSPSSRFPSVLNIPTGSFVTVTRSSCGKKASDQDVEGGALLTCQGLSYKHNYGAHGRPQQNRIDIGVAHKGQAKP